MLKIVIALFPLPWFYLNRQHDAGTNKNKSSDKMKTSIVAETAVTIEATIDHRSYKARNGRYRRHEAKTLFFGIKFGRKQILGYCMEADDEVVECVHKAREIVSDLEEYGITYPLAWVVEFVTLQFRAFRDSIAVAA